MSTNTAGIEVPTGAYDATDLLRIPNVDPNFYYMNRGKVFYKLLQLIGGSTSVDQPRHEFFKDDKFETVVTPSTDYASGATTVVLDQANAVAPRAVLYNQTTDEAIYVTAVSGASLTVTRGHQGTTAAAITAATDKLIVLETSLPEGGEAGEGIAKLPTKDHAVVSFYSETLSGTDLQEATRMLNESGKIQGQMADYTDKLLEQMDNSLRWSTRDIDTTTDSDGTLFYTGGFNSTVTTNDVNLTGTLTWQDFNDEFNTIFDQTESSPMKFLLCGPTLYDKINTISWQHHVGGQAVPVFEPTLGAYIKDIQLSQGGKIKLIRDPYGFSTAKGVDHKGFLIDPAFINLIHFANWDMIWRDVSVKEGHTKRTEVFGSVGLRIPREEAHATVYWTVS
jgi:hypothetical protein